MKKLIISIAMITITLFCNAAGEKPANDIVTAPEPSSDDIITNTTKTAEYRRRGSMGTSDYIVSKLLDNQLVKFGTTERLLTPEEEDMGLDYMVGSVYLGRTDRRFISMIDFGPTGLEFLHPDSNTYFGLTSTENYFSKPFVWCLMETNGVKHIASRKIELPGTNSVTTTVKQDSNQVFADRSWVIEILKAYRDGKLTINDDNTIIIRE